MSRCTLPFVVAGCLMVPVSAAAQDVQEVSFRQGVDGYEGAGDTNLMQANPDQNRFKTDVMMVQKRDYQQSPDSAGQVLLHFDGVVGNGERQVPPNATLVSATLELFVSDQYGGYSDEVQVYEMTKAFDTESASWSSTGGGIDVKEETAAEPISTFTMNWKKDDDTGVKNVSIDVLEVVDKWLADAEKNMGFAVMISPESHMGPQQFDTLPLASSEAENPEIRPRLTVEYVVEDAAAEPD